MNPIIAFTIQFLSVVFISSLVAKWYVSSNFKTHSLRTLLLPFVAMHVLRTIGLIYVTPEVFGIDPNLPKAFLSATAYGDLLAAVLAAVAVSFLLRKQKNAYTWVWIFNVVGFLDLLFAMANGIHNKVLDYHVGIAWFLPAFIVPALVVSHLVVFYLLIKHPDAKQNGPS